MRKTLVDFLVKYGFDDKRLVKKIIANGLVHVNGKMCKDTSRLIEESDIIDIKSKHWLSGIKL